MQHRIDVTPHRHCAIIFPRTCNQFKDQIREKINTDLETGRVVPSKSSNAIGMFTQPKRDNPNEARFLLHCIPRNHVTHKDKTPMPSMEQIIVFVGSRLFRSNVDLTDGYNNITMHPELVKDRTFCSHMGNNNSLVMQQGDYNVPATLMRAMNFLFKNIKNLMLDLDDILIANHTYE